MNYAQIAALLDKYWEGETSLQEEQQLKQYFRTGPIDPRLQPLAPMFQTLDAEKQVMLPTSIQMQAKVRVLPWRTWAAAASVALVLTAGGWWFMHKPIENQTFAVTPPPTSVQPLYPTPTTPQTDPIPSPQHKPGKILKRFKGLFAHQENRLTKKERAEADKAMHEVKAALALVSSKLNRGRSEASKNLNHLETIDKIFKKKKETTG
jgi:hypothetical protein